MQCRVSSKTLSALAFPDYPRRKAHQGKVTISLLPTSRKHDIIGTQGKEQGEIRKRAPEKKYPTEDKQLGYTDDNPFR